MKKLRVKPRIYVLCNGERAEPQYFQDFKDHLREHNIIVKYKKFQKKAPWDFIESGIKYKEDEKSKGKFVQKDGDQVWCVFDVDNYWDENEKKFRDALKLAEDNNLQIAWSNECFEFWFLCHFAFYNTLIPRADHYKKLAKNFKDKKLGTYSKNMKGIFDLLFPIQKSAIKHAKKLHKKGKVQNNPSTAVHLLTEQLLDYFA